jgi:uncharacterized protein YjbJ (UPF0337 family)
MNEDRVAGTAKNLGGKVEEGIGRVAGDIKSQVAGKAKQVEGEMQDLYGQAKETAIHAAETVRDGARDVEDYLRSTIEQRPFTVAAIALGLGYVLGRMGRAQH